MEKDGDSLFDCSFVALFLKIFLILSRFNSSYNFTLLGFLHYTKLYSQKIGHQTVGRMTFMKDVTISFCFIYVTWLFHSSEFLYIFQLYLN